MYVCVCKSITDKDIRKAVANGTHSFSSMRRDLNLASQCGKCGGLARQIFDESISTIRDDSLFYAADTAANTSAQELTA